ncbi:hypothetical protein ACTXT7_004547 [Hymenolepis weldensis]
MCRRMYVVYIGGKIGFYSGNVATVSDDMKVLKPTVFTTVPRLLCRIFDAITQKVSKSPFKKFLLKYALKEKCHQVDKQVFKNNSIWDTLVFSRIRSKFGGNLRLVLVAGAPVSPPVLRFMRAVFSCPISIYICSEQMHLKIDLYDACMMLFSNLCYLDSDVFSSKSILKYVMLKFAKFIPFPFSSSNVQIMAYGTSVRLPTFVNCQKPCSLPHIDKDGEDKDNLWELIIPSLDLRFVGFLSVLYSDDASSGIVVLTS